MAYKPTVVFDFDGVIHSYTSGWKGEAVIPDPVVDGISDVIANLRSKGLRVVVVSTRCQTYAGISAIRDYLEKNGIKVDEITALKPPAVCYVDDRSICFNGNTAGLLEEILNFHSWTEHKKDVNEPVRRLRPCSAQRWIKGHYENKVFIEGHHEEIKGLFHCWGTDYEEFETGPGCFSTAIIEMDDGSIVNCPAEFVKFLDR